MTVICTARHALSTISQHKSIPDLSTSFPFIPYMTSTIASRTVVVSNRLPITLDAQGSVKPGSGGLATALGSIDESRRLWIGYIGTESEEDLSLEARTQLADHNYVPVHIDNAIYDLYYNSFSNQVLWLLLHYMPELDTLTHEDWHAYVEANRIFAKTIADNIDPQTTDCVFLQDYHLFLVPSFLRQELKARYGSEADNLFVSFFLHIPFPSSELLRALPQREQILESLLQCDLIGMHTNAYVQHFLSSCVKVLNAKSSSFVVRYKGRYTWTYSFPIGIQPSTFSSALLSEEGVDMYSQLLSQHKDKKIIVGCDRLDPSKGLLLKLRAFKVLLETHPELHNKVVLIQVAVPSRETVPKYAQLVQDINRLVGEINGDFSTPMWTPCVYLHRAVPRSLLCALYSMADVCLVSSARDGLNLVASEFVVCQEAKKEMEICQNHSPGVLVLSEFAGAASSLNGALLCNPCDVEQSAILVYDALVMPEPMRVSRHVRNLNWIVKENSVDKWFNKILLHQRAWKEVYSHLPSSSAASPLDSLSLTSTFVSSRSRVLLLDYDGTLVDFYPEPSQAVPDESLLKNLSSIISDPSNTVYIVSGRKREDLDQFFGTVKGIGLVGEHGVCLKHPNDQKWTELITNQEREIIAYAKESLRPLLEVLVSHVPGSSIEEKQCSLAWHYRNCDNILVSTNLSELGSLFNEMCTSLPIDMLHGDKVIEFRSKTLNKGTAVKTVLSSLDKPFDWIMTIGDDVTDEQMFEYFKNSSDNAVHQEKLQLKDSSQQAVIGRLMLNSVSTFFSQKTSSSDKFVLDDQTSVYTIKVGSGPTAADFYLANPEKVNQMIECLAAMTRK
ncbi:hypothetical protein GEMRC1_001460 [Eukaryota sp. GEM-RC1]